MKRIVLGVVAAGLALFATSSLLALATASPEPASVTQDAAFEAWVSDQIDAQYRAMLARNDTTP